MVDDLVGVLGVRDRCADAEFDGTD